MFLAEDPVTFADRISEAYYARQQTEALLRYNFYIDCMPMDGMGEVDQTSLQRMIEWARGPHHLNKDKR
jgi:dynein heavy chain